MKFAFDTDEVLRDTISKMKATYEKFFIEKFKKMFYLKETN